jgi:dethiobiotin synthetase
MRGLFVTGTDTGVGKTVVTAALALALRDRGLDVRVVKPVQSGAHALDPEGDAAILRRLAELTATEDVIAPYSFTAPLAPLVAARLEGRSLELAEVAQQTRAAAEGGDFALVEGAGGLLVPVGREWTIADLASELGLPLLVVARAGLGTVNHTALTVRVARELGLDVAGVVLNATSPDLDESVATNRELVEGLTGVNVVGSTPWVADPLTPTLLQMVIAPAIDLDFLVRTTETEAAIA